MLLRYDLRVWEVRDNDDEFIDFVVASTAEEASQIVFKITSLNQFELHELDPLTGKILFD